jgi:hypothetical protein
MHEQEFAANSRDVDAKPPGAEPEAHWQVRSQVALIGARANLGPR